MKTILIIPVYDENSVILQELIDKSRAYISNIVVIDDGSKTSHKLNGCKVLRNDKNYGKGYSLRRGIEFARTKKYDWAFFMDGDGEHLPDDLPRFIEKAKNCNILIGQRNLFRSSSRARLNSFSLFWVRFLIPEIRDLYCGYRALNLDASRAIRLRADGFETDLEMILEAWKHKLKISYIDISKTKTAKSKVTSRDYIRINNFFDKWLLQNKNNLNLTFFRRLFLLFFAGVGLILGRTMRGIL